MSDNAPLMSEDDLYSTDTRAVKELKALYVHLWECADMELENANNAKRRQKAVCLGGVTAYQLAADAVADAIKSLGHKLPRLP